MIHFLRLTRPLNLLITAGTMYGMGWFLESQYSNSEVYGVRSFTFFLLVISTIMIAGAGNVINDYFDVRADRVNKPEKLIIGIHLKRRWAIISHWILNIIAFGIAVYLSAIFNTFWYVFIHLLSINLLWGYSSYFKRKFAIGNIIIAALTAFVPILVAIYFHIHHDLKFSQEPQTFPYNIISGSYLVWSTAFILAFFAFALNLTREIVKDIQDVAGDKLMRARTIPIVLGEKSTKLICYFILTGTLATLLFIQLYFEIENFNASLPIWAAVLSTIIALFLLVFSQTKQQLKRVDLMLKLAMVSGLLAPIIWKYLIISHV